MPISFNFSPLAALVLGILIGFLIEWFLELLYFRRQRRGSEERLARAEADLQARSRDLLAIRTQADALRSDLSTAKARVTSLQAELQACQAATADAHGQAASLQTQLHDTTTQVSGLQSGRQDVDTRLTSALGELERLRAQVGDANTRRDSLDAALQAREAAYKSLDTALAESRTHESALQDELARLRTDFQARIPLGPRGHWKAPSHTADADAAARRPPTNRSTRPWPNPTHGCHPGRRSKATWTACASSSTRRPPAVIHSIPRCKHVTQPIEHWNPRWLNRARMKHPCRTNWPTCGRMCTREIRRWRNRTACAAS